MIVFLSFAGSTMSNKRPGMAVKLLSKFDAIPSKSKYLQNGHVLHLFVLHHRKYADTARQVMSNCQDTSVPLLQLKSAIKLLVLKSLNKYRQLSVPSKKTAFMKICSQKFVVQSRETEETQTTDIELEQQEVQVTQGSSTRASIKCATCPLLKSTIRKLVREKQELRQKNVLKMKQLRNELKPIKRLNQIIKRKNDMVAKAKKRLNESVLMRENKNLKRKLKRKSQGQRVQETKCKMNMQKLVAKKVSELQSEFEDRWCLIQDKENSALQKERKEFSPKMRRIVYDHILANVPTSNIPSLILSVATQLGVQVTDKDVPSRSTVEIMTLELGVLSDLQAAQTLHDTNNVTLGFDSTTQEGYHINSVHITTVEKCLIVSIEQLPGGTAADYANHVISSVDHLAELYSKFHDLDYNAVRSQMVSNISCTMSDRAAVNHAAVRLINENFKKTLLEVNCHLHPLDTIASKCKSEVKKIEEKENFTSSLFGNSCGSENLVLAMNKMRFKDGKGDPLGFRLFLEKEGLGKGLIPRYRGNRLHIFFELCLIYFQYKDKFLDYLENRCLNNTSLKTGLIKDFKNPVIVSQLQTLAAIGILLTKPWMKLFYVSEQGCLSHMQGYQKVQSVISNIKTFLTSTPTHIIQDFFGNSLPNCSLFEKLDFTTLNVLLQNAVVHVIERQYQRYHTTVNDSNFEQLNNMSASARLHNIDSEQVMGMFSSLLNRAPNSTILFMSAKIRAQKNKTLDFLDTIDDKTFQSVRTFSKTVKSRNSIQISEIKQELQSRINKKMQAKEKTTRNKIEKKFKGLIGNKHDSIKMQFPDLNDDEIGSLHEMLSGNIVGRSVLHNWAVGENLTIETYHGKIEKVKKLKRDMKYIVCYWREGETHEIDGEDFVVSVTEIAADFMCKDFYVL
jgi:hypothetical protein